jgi:hypothetical protein
MMPTSVCLSDDVYPNDRPARDESIWNHVGNMEFESGYFKTRLVNPVVWFTAPFHGDQTPKEVFEDYAEDCQKELVEEYRKTAKQLNETRFVVMDGDTLVDGWHRMVAFALEGITEARAVDLNLPTDAPEEPE